MHRSTTGKVVSLLLTLVAAGDQCTADDEIRGLSLSGPMSAAIVPPLLDDAGLNDVQMVSEKLAWAVGDRGCLWRSTDGAVTWSLVPMPVDAALRSVCFLTDRVGWLVGGGIQRNGRSTYGVVLRTTDGGEHWDKFGGADLPLLHDVQFFDLSTGIAVGETSTSCPTGIFTTSDGGETWQPISGHKSDGWRCCAFLNPTAGFVAGRLGRYATVSQMQLQASPAGASGLRGIRDVVIRPDFQGWFVGDGGLVLHTDTGGVSWRPPDGELPREVRDAMDFHAVAAVGSSVWAGGSPGSVIWHSSDAGATWTAQATGNPLPLESISFISPMHGCAVGAMGRILRTTDGGTTWNAVRGGQRRAALLAIHAHEHQVSLCLPTKYSRELGYRTVVSVVARRDIGPDGDDGRLLDLRLHDALSLAGGACATVDWAFPIAAPGLDRDQAALVREWELLTDNRLREKMLARLVCLLCVWRPEVVVIDAPSDADAATGLLADAVKLAIRQAADSSHHPILHQNTELPPWRVKRLFRRQPSGSGGGVRLDAFEFLPRLGMSVTMAAAGPGGLLPRPSNLSLHHDETYVPLNTGTDQSTTEDVRDLFAGLGISPDSDARRPLLPMDDSNFEQQQQLAQRQRNFAAYAARMLDDPRHAAQLVAQTREIVAGAPDPQAAVQLFHLANEYRRRGEWDHAEAVLTELVERYPQEPAAAEAMVWLLSLWTSSEVGWQRLRHSSSLERTRETVDGSIVQANLQQTIQEKRGQDGEVPDGLETSPVFQTSATGQLRVGDGQEQHAEKLKSWLNRAERLVKSLRDADPASVQAANLQVQLAAFHRKLDHPRQADEIYRAFINESAGNPWNRIAAGELWLVQPSTIASHPIAVCRRTPTPPVLDGILDDICWQKASSAQLRNESEHQQYRDPIVDEPSDSNRARIQWAYDQGFLYIAARIPREPSLPADRPELPGRSHDADLLDFDRLSFALDTDRDYVTHYEINVDQRGWSSDACWENHEWNCQRFIAIDADAREWRVEMAIPFTELVPEAPRKGDTWAAGIARVMPTVGVESWTYPAGSTPRPEGFGLLRFE